MNRLLCYIENELERNSVLFAESEAHMTAGIDFINFVLKNENFTKLTPQEEYYINKLKECYLNMKTHLVALKEEIQNYKEAYKEVFNEK